MAKAHTPKQMTDKAVQMRDKAGKQRTQAAEMHHTVRQTNTRTEAQRERAA